MENMPLQPSPIYSCSWQVSQSTFFPVNLLCSYILIGNCVRGQKLTNGPGVGKCPASGQCKICKFPTPGTDKAGKCPQLARGGGLVPAGIDWCIRLLSMVHPSPASPGICHKRIYAPLVGKEVPGEEWTSSHSSLRLCLLQDGGVFLRTSCFYGVFVWHFYRVRIVTRGK